MNREFRQREYTLDHALVLASSSLDELNINYTLQEIGNAGELYTYLCLVNNHKLQLTFRGAGSGLTQEAKVKAIYEAIENSLLYEILSQGDENMIYMFSTLSSPSSTFLQENELLPPILRQKIFLENDYPWLKLNKLHVQGDNIYYPLSLLFPHAHHIDMYNKHVNQSDVSQIANSTGTAMGATESEALMHGINDWIERDAYSLFLLNTIIKKNKSAHCVLKKTLPESIRKYIEVIENIHSDELMIIDITTDLGIPTFLASFTRQSVPVQPSGLGASLCKIDALQHALFEALQARDRYNNNTIAKRQKTILHYQAHPALLPVFICDLVQLREEGLILDISWQDVITHHINSNLNEQIDLIKTKIQPFGITIYYKTLFQAKNGLTLIYVLLVGVETFGMMREGMFIPIKKRGLEKIK